MEVLDEPIALRRHRLTVDDYYRMAETGVLAPDARVELIDGEIIDMAPMASRHAAAINALIEALAAARNRAIVTCQTPLRLSAQSEPEPDLMLLKPRVDRYRDALPTAADVLLLIEVADTSLAYDRGVKLPLYARHGVGEVWIVDLENRALRFFRRPVAGTYTDIGTTETPGPTPIAALPEVRLDLSGLL